MAVFSMTEITNREILHKPTGGLFCHAITSFIMITLHKRIGESRYIMKRTWIVLFTALTVILAVFVTAYWVSHSHPQHSFASYPAAYRLVEVTSGLSRPVYVTHAGDGSNRLFVVEQTGRILIVQGGNVLQTPFLDVSGLISPEALQNKYTERGLLGLAFHPDYSKNGLFFIDYTDLNGNTVVARYMVSATDPNQADPSSAVPILSVEQPYSNHNGGDLVFGPDGYLYIALGDGGSAGDPQGNGQNLGTLLGSILRVDVNNTETYRIPPDNPFVDNVSARPEIWAYGLRNPWRFSFDRQTGELVIGDVGQDKWEEINVQPASSKGGENYGWNIMEGMHPYSGVAAPADLVMPVLEYGHDAGRCSVTGGYVYRGSAMPDLEGYYFYGDWCTGTVWAAQHDSAGVWQTTISLESGRKISSFGEDETGELYLVDYAGTVLRLEPDSAG
jgi:glucose/arabinose dehydrogenase